MLGRVVTLNTSKRFGFIRENGSDREFYFHASAVDRRLSFDDLLDERIDFDARENERGLLAGNVRPVEWQPSRSR